MSKCTSCGEDKPLKTAIKSGVYLSNMCERCIANFSTSAIYARRNEREWQKKHYRKDTIQRFNGNDINPEYVRAYPEESRKQWGDDILRTEGVDKKLL